MTKLVSAWFRGVSWEDVELLHRGLCSSRQLREEVNPSGLATARALWEAAAGRMQTLRQALEVCRQCLAAKPFVFMNISTMAAVAPKLLEDGLETLPAVEAQIIRSTVAHYIAGQVPANELEQVLKHFEGLWLRGTRVEPARSGSMEAGLGIQVEPAT